MACNEQMREEFATLHEAVEEILKSEGLAALPGGRPMPRADYQNLTKAVRRLLKQVGRSSGRLGSCGLIGGWGRFRLRQHAAAHNLR